MGSIPTTSLGAHHSNTGSVNAPCHNQRRSITDPGRGDSRQRRDPRQPAPGTHHASADSVVIEAGFDVRTTFLCAWRKMSYMIACREGYWMTPTTAKVWYLAYCSPAFRTCS